MLTPPYDPFRAIADRSQSPDYTVRAASVGMTVQN